MPKRSYDGYAILFNTGYDQLEKEGWELEITDDGLICRNGKLVREIVTVDSLGSLLSKDDVDDAVMRLHIAKNQRTN